MSSKSARCFFELLFIVIIGLSTSAQALERTNIKEQFSGYALVINCSHDELENETTSNDVSVYWYNDSNLLYSSHSSIPVHDGMQDSGSKYGEYSALVDHLDQSKSPWSKSPKCNDSYDALYFYPVEQTQKITKIRIEISGDDAFFIDEADIHYLYAYSFFDDWPRFDIVRTDIRHFGKEDGTGWCLSTDRQDAKGKWRPATTYCGDYLDFVPDTSEVKLHVEADAEVNDLGAIPNGESCFNDDNCASGSCARLTAAKNEPLKCCASGDSALYAGHYYCTKMPTKSVCWSDAQCASGTCSGNSLGFARGTCK